MTIIDQAAHTIMETDNRIQGHKDDLAAALLAAANYLTMEIE